MRTREEYIDGMARGTCALAGIAIIDPDDGSPNWWIFRSDVTPLVDSLIARGIFQTSGD